MNKPTGYVDVLRAQLELKPELKKKDGKLNVNAAARFLGIQQSTLLRVLAGGKSGIQKPNQQIVEAMQEKFGLSLAEAMGRPTAAEGLSTMAAAIGRRWEAAPETLRSHIVALLDGWDAFVTANPMAPLLFPKGRPDSARSHERTMEYITARARRTNSAVPKKRSQRKRPE